MRNLLLVPLILVLFAGCHIISPNLMFKTPAEFKYSDFSGKIETEYKISPNDLLHIGILTNDGLKLVELVPNTGSDQKSSSAALEFTVDQNGEIRMPTIGAINLKGLTIKQAEEKIEKVFAEFYIKPFASIKVLNRRVFIYNGAGGTGNVVYLKNENTTLFEALTSAGGIASTGKSDKVKLVRGPIDNPEIQIIDLSTTQGMKKANIVMQNNDIVYVEPVKNIPQGIIAQISPYVALLTTALLIFQLTK